MYPEWGLARKRKENILNDHTGSEKHSRDPSTAVADTNRMSNFANVEL